MLGMRWLGVVLATPLVGVGLSTVRADFVLSGSEHLGVNSIYENGALYDTSTAEVVEGGSIHDLYASNASRISISGGSTGRLYSYDSSSVAVSGGSLGNLEGYDTSTVDISGGSVSNLTSYDSSTVDISGGDVSSYVQSYDTSTVDISGGDVKRLGAYDTSIVTLHGYDFRVTGGLRLQDDTVSGTGPLTGKWFDKTAWVVVIVGNSSDATIRIVIIPEPFGITSSTAGNWNAPATWGDGSATPTEDSEMTVTQHTVTVAADGSAQSLLIDDDGSVVIGHSSNLTVVNALEINNGTLEILPAGTVSVGGDLTMTPQAEYAYQIDATANGLTTVSGDADLDGTLIVQATGGLDAIGLTTHPIIVAGRIVDSFANEPAIGGHLGYGVFHQGAWYNFAAGVVREEVFQAAAGDIDGDGQIDNGDLQGILSANSFNVLGDWDWSQGDFDGDGLVDNGDLQLVLATGYFGDGLYVAAPSWGSRGKLVIIPEPPVLILLLSGLVTLAGFRRLGRRAA